MTVIDQREDYVCVNGSTVVNGRIGHNGLPFNSIELSIDGIGVDGWLDIEEGEQPIGHGIRVHVNGQGLLLADEARELIGELIVLLDRLEAMPKP